jgi:hypothetical protein
MGIRVAAMPGLGLTNSIQKVDGYPRALTTRFSSADVDIRARDQAGMEIVGLSYGRLNSGIRVRYPLDSVRISR